MIILTADIPQFVLKFLFYSRKIHSWIYLGKSLTTAQSLRRLLDGRAAEVDYAQDLYSVSEEMRRPFVEWIDEISLTQSAPEEWFYSTVSIKNPYFSDAFLTVCYFFIFEKLLKQNSLLDVVVVDSPALAVLLKKYFPQHCRWSWMNLLGSAAGRGRAMVKAMGRWVKYVEDILRRVVAAKTVLGRRSQSWGKEFPKVVLIRNYIFDDFTAEEPGMFERHFFPGLDAYLEANHYTPVFLSYPLSRSKNYRTLFARVKESRKKIIIADELFTAADYGHSLLAPWRALTYRIKPCRLGFYDLTGILREEYARNLTDSGLLAAALFSRLGERLKQNNWEPLGIVNWAEFQAFEKGLIRGLKRAWPKIQNIASQPFHIPPNHLSLVPSRQDKILNIVPDRILSLGSVGKELATEFLPDIPSDFSPAFRYQTLLKFPSTVSAAAQDALVLFGYGLDNALHILRLLTHPQEILSSFQNVLLKLHPGSYFAQERLLKEFGKPLPANFQFISGGLADHLGKISLGICGATGSAVELVMKGIPLVVIAETHALTMNYLAKKADPDIWRLCFCQKDVLEAILKFPQWQSQSLGTADVLRGKARAFQQAYFADDDGRHWENYLIQPKEELHYVP